MEKEREREGGRGVGGEKLKETKERKEGQTIRKERERVDCKRKHSYLVRSPS